MALLRVPNEAMAAVRHPLVGICLAVALWSALLAPLAEYPLLSLVGSPQVADGVVLWCDIGVFVVAMRLIAGNRQFVLATGVTAACAALLLPALAAFPATRAIWFNDYLAFLGLGAAVVIPYCFQDVVARRWLPALAVLAGAPAILVSQNHAAAILIVTAAIPAALLCHWYLRDATPNRLARARWGSAALVLALAAAIPAAAKLSDSLGFSKSLQSRNKISEVLLNVFPADSKSWAIGKGWGHTQLYFSEFLSTTDAKIWNKEWDAAWRDIFHSHNFILEALLSAGIPAAAAVLLFVVSPLLFCSRRQLPVAEFFALGFTGTASIWFQMPGTVAMTAIAFAVFTRMTPAPDKGGFLRFFVAVSLTGVMLGQIVAISMLSRHLQQTAQVEKALEQWAGTDCPEFSGEHWRGNTGMSLQFMQSINNFKYLSEGDDHEPAARVMDYFACLSDRLTQHRPERLLLHTELLFRAEIAYSNDFAPIRPRFVKYLQNWENLVRLHLRLSPNRADLVLPFLSWSLARNQTSKVMELTAQILANNPDDPVGLWFRGMAVLQSGGREKSPNALELLRLGIKHGIEKWLPLQPDTKARILSEGNPQ